MRGDRNNMSFNKSNAIVFFNALLSPTLGRPAQSLVPLAWTDDYMLTACFRLVNAAGLKPFQLSGHSFTYLSCLVYDAIDKNCHCYLAARGSRDVDGDVMEIFGVVHSESTASPQGTQISEKRRKVNQGEPTNYSPLSFYPYADISCH